jgi:hypothetical protein
MAWFCQSQAVDVNYISFEQYCLFQIRADEFDEGVPHQSVGQAIAVRNAA